MEDSAKKPERRSLLPQKLSTSGQSIPSKVSSHTSRSRISYTQNSGSKQSGSEKAAHEEPSSNAPTHSHIPEITEEGSELKQPPKQASKLQAPGNIGRSLSLRGQNSRSTNPSSIQRSRSIRSTDQPARPSRIGAPQTINEDTPNHTASNEDPPPSSRSSSTSHTHETEHAPTTRAPSNDPRPSAPRLNAAISRHSRSSSQQVPSSTSHPPSVDNPASKPTTLGKPRPAFSTHQQHFTPRKAPKATTASILAPPKPHVQEPLSPETTRLQLELLQFHLLHRDSASTHRQWEDSAKRHFKQQYDSLTQDEIELDEGERRAQTAINYPALVAWSQSSSSTDFAERIRILSRNLAEVSGLLQSGSKYARVIKLFENWSTNASRVRDTRGSSPEGFEEGEIEFVESIGDGWKAELSYLERKLIIAEEELQGLGEPADQGTSIQRVVALLKRSVGQVLEELGVMRDVEGKLVEAEREWIEREVKRLVKDDGLGDRMNGEKGIWHDTEWGGG